MKGSIYKRSSGIYYYEWPAMRVKKSLKTRKYDEAYEVVVKNYSHLWQKDKTEAFREGLEKMKKSQDQELELAQTLQGHDSILLDDIMAEYIKVLSTLVSKGSKRHQDAKTALSPRTLKDVESRLKKLIVFIKLHHPNVCKMNQVTALVARDYFKNFKLSMSSRNRYRSDFHAIFDRLKVEAGLKENPFDAVPVVSKSEVEDEAATKEPWTLEELKRINDYAEGWLKLAFTFGFYTSLRLADVITLKWADIDGDFLEIKTRKSSQESTHYIPQVIPHLKEHRKVEEDEEYIFGNQARGLLRRNNSSYQCRVMSDFFKSLGIETKNKAGKTVKGFHSFRKAYATYHQVAGADKKYIQERLAHSSSEMTEGYIMLNDEQEKTRLVQEYIPLSMDGTLDNDNILIEQIKKLTERLSNKPLKEQLSKILS